MILDLFFKIIISSSLPSSWDNFTQAYIAKVRCHITHDPFKNMNSLEFIGIIKAEAKCHLKYPTNAANTAYSTKGRSNKGKLLLLNHITLKLKGIKTSDNIVRRWIRNLSPTANFAR